jgi:hypothetical protein
MNYDGDAHTILQKHVKDLATKYKRYFHRFGIKLLTKITKNGICPTDGGKICINHNKCDDDLKATHVYCILSQEAYSNHEDTTKDINEIVFVTCEVGVEVADEVAEEYSQGKLNLISCILHIVSGG